MMRLLLLGTVMIIGAGSTSLPAAAPVETPSCQRTGTFDPCFIYAPLVHLTPAQNEAIIAEFARVNLLVDAQLATGISAASCAAATAAAKTNNRYDLVAYVDRRCASRQ